MHACKNPDNDGRVRNGRFRERIFPDRRAGHGFVCDTTESAPSRLDESMLKLARVQNSHVPDLTGIGCAYTASRVGGMLSPFLKVRTVYTVVEVHRFAVEFAA